jgi:hypothetical protein
MFAEVRAVRCTANAGRRKTRREVREEGTGGRYGREVREASMGGRYGGYINEYRREGGTGVGEGGREGAFGRNTLFH